MTEDSPAPKISAFELGPRLIDQLSALIAGKLSLRWSGSGAQSESLGVTVREGIGLEKNSCGS
jgi:hypothetical protein